VIGRWSLDYIRVWLKAGLVESANLWLTGTLLWPRWLRLAGMKIGRGCELSSIIDTIPELVEIGPRRFWPTASTSRPEDSPRHRHACSGSPRPKYLFRQ